MVSDVVYLLILWRKYEWSKAQHLYKFKLVADTFATFTKNVNVGIYGPCILRPLVQQKILS